MVRLQNKLIIKNYLQSTTSGFILNTHTLPAINQPNKKAAPKLFIITSIIFPQPETQKYVAYGLSAYVGTNIVDLSSSNNNAIRRIYNRRKYVEIKLFK